MYEVLWCKVEVVFFLVGGQNKIIYDGFIEDYMVLGFYNVYLYGKRGDVKIGLVYIFVIDCDVMVNNYGEVFIFISIVFCLCFVLSLSEYFILM